MIKEYLLVIFLGTILGFGITGGYYALRQNKTTKQEVTDISPTPTITEIQISTQVSVTPSVSATKTSINITSPENGTVISTSKTSIKGDAKPNSLIVISTPSQTFSGEANSNGIFSINIQLDSGVNLIKISSVDLEDNQEETELTLTYSTAKI